MGINTKLKIPLTNNKLRVDKKLIIRDLNSLKKRPRRDLTKTRLLLKELKDY